MLETGLFALLEQTADAAYTVTDGGEICSWNGAAERLFGYSASVCWRSPDSSLRLRMMRPITHRSSRSPSTSAAS